MCIKRDTCNVLNLDFSSFDCIMLFFFIVCYPVKKFTNNLYKIFLIIRLIMPTNNKNEEILSIVIVILILCLMKLRPKPRRWWVRPLLLHRDALGFGATVFHHVIDDDPELFKSYIRLTPDQFNYILGLVHLKLRKRSRRQAILPRERLLITL